jgi:hypothetical protein
VGRVTTEPTLVVKAIGDPHSSEPLVASSCPRDVEATLSALAPDAVLGGDLGIIKEDDSA